jgi:hypothetical protein
MEFSGYHSSITQMPTENTPLFVPAEMTKRQRELEESRNAQQKLKYATAFCLLFMIAEIIGGFMGVLLPTNTTTTYCSSGSCNTVVVVG